VTLNSIDKRLSKLEGLTAACSECGAGPGMPVRFVIEDYSPNFEPKSCGTCRRTLAFTMFIGDVAFDDLTDDDADGN
jgi:hypothetical protein